MMARLSEYRFSIACIVGGMVWEVSYHRLEGDGVLILLLTALAMATVMLWLRPRVDPVVLIRWRTEVSASLGLEPPDRRGGEAGRHEPPASEARSA